MEVGRIAHKVLERHLGADRDRPVEEIIDEEIAGDLREIDLGVRRDIVRRNLRSWLLFTLEREGRSGDPFRPVEHELPFVEEHRVAVPLGPDGDEEVILRGKIDRVDFAEIEGREVAIVVDYKTSRGFEGRDRQAIIDLDDVQLYVYALAAERRLDRRVVGAEIFPLKSSARGGVYRKEVEAILGGRVEVKKPVFLDEDEWEAFLVAGRERIAAVVKAMRAGEKARAPADPADCRSNRCPAFLVCRPDRWGMAARLRAAAREEES